MPDPACEPCVRCVQLVDRLDQGYAFAGAPYGNMSYQALYAMVSRALFRTHVEGQLKAEIIQVRARGGSPPLEGGRVCART